MAVYAAHLTRTLQGTPTVFQVTAQEALGATVKPALRKVAEFLSTTYPTKCGWCVRWYDELYLVLDWCLQYHYLKYYSASFSESFYGLMRVPTSHASEFSSGQRLSPRAEYASLMVLTVLPYLAGKMEQAVDTWREEHHSGALGKDTRDRLRRAAVQVYSIMHVAVTGWRMVQLARYMTGRVEAHSPALGLLGLALREAPPPLAVEDEYTWGDLYHSITKGDFRSMVVSIPMLGSGLLGAVQWGAFLVQFLRWWEGNHPRHQHALPPPPPPLREERALKWKNKCPVCLHSWKVPTVLPVSGYIFCYVCVSRGVRASGSCPVTGLPAHPSQLVRLYVD